MARVGVPAVVLALLAALVVVGIPGVAFGAASDVEAATKSVVSLGLAAGQNSQIGGSGVVVGDGYVLTNYHVLKGLNDAIVGAADQGYQIEAYVNNGESNLPLIVVALDQQADLGLVRVRGLSRPSIVWGDSNALTAGQTVFTLGYPSGLKNVTTGKGIISQTHQVFGGTTYIQTDARISPGNSGGALVDENGEFMGVTSAYVPSAQAIGLVVPSAVALDFIKDEAPDVYATIKKASASKPIISNPTTPGIKIDNNNGALLGLGVPCLIGLCGLLLVILVVVVVLMMRKKKPATLPVVESTPLPPVAPPSGLPPVAPSAPLPPAAPGTVVSAAPGTVVSGPAATMISTPADAVTISIKSPKGEHDVTVGLPAVIGRTPGCDVMIDDSEISRRHAEISRVDGELQIKDLGSSNGTMLNGTRVQTSAFKPGDKIALGKSELVVK